ncbi:hypothetical protein FISHEDRAFT_78130 [Fistulina hepatica ATCC 64428]|nr:hypothetical protein FISHEDRAFT_78130 [Fistulina hepatica ATCC 64428]
MDTSSSAIRHPWFLEPHMKRAHNSSSSDDGLSSSDSPPPPRAKRFKYATLEHGFSCLSVGSRVQRDTPGVASSACGVLPSSIEEPSPVERPPSPVRDIHMHTSRWYEPEPDRELPPHPPVPPVVAQPRRLGIIITDLGSDTSEDEESDERTSNSDDVNEPSRPRVTVSPAALELIRSKTRGTLQSTSSSSSGPNQALVLYTPPSAVLPRPPARSAPSSTSNHACEVERREDTSDDMVVETIQVAAPPADTLPSIAPSTRTYIPSSEGTSFAPEFPSYPTSKIPPSNPFLPNNVPSVPSAPLTNVMFSPSAVSLTFTPTTLFHSGLAPPGTPFSPPSDPSLSVSPSLLDPFNSSTPGAFRAPPVFENGSAYPSFTLPITTRYSVPEENDYAMDIEP